MMTRAGTNVARGTINYQYWTNKLNALNVQQKQTFNDVALQAFKAGRSHNSAFTLGGPLNIPKLVDGRGKVFFFANYSYVNDSIPGRNQGNNTVPANEKHLQGDFSDMLRLPNPNQYIIYDPLTARPDPANPNRVIRTPFPNNVIPRDRIFNPDGTYKNKLFGLYAAAVPKANQNFVEQGQQPTGNYFRGAEPSIPVSHLFGLRLDYNLSSSDRLFLRGSGSRYHEDVDDWTFESPTPEFRGLHDSDRDRYTWSYTGNWTRTFGQTVLDTQLSANKFYTLDKQNELTKYKPTDFGLPSYLDEFCASKDACQMPRVNIDGYQQLSRDVKRQSDETTNFQGQFNATQVRGSHTLRGGVDVRKAMRAPHRRRQCVGAVDLLARLHPASQRRGAVDAEQPRAEPCSVHARRSDIDPARRSGGRLSLQPLRRHVRAGQLAHDAKPDAQRRLALRVPGRHPREG